MQKYRIIDYSVKPAFLIYLALSLLLLPFWWVLAWFTAVAVHELSHLLMLRLLGLTIYNISFDINGAKIEAEHMMNYRELLCALAGPLGGYLLVLFIRVYPELAVCGVLQSVYNMLPIYPLDGGRILRCLLNIITHNSVSGNTIKYIEWFVLAMLFSVALYSTFVLKLGVLPLILVFALFLKNKSVKFPCKQVKLIVQ